MRSPGGKAFSGFVKTLLVGEVTYALYKNAVQKSLKSTGVPELTALQFYSFLPLSCVQQPSVSQLVSFALGHDDFDDLPTLAIDKETEINQFTRCAYSNMEFTKTKN